MTVISTYREEHRLLPQLWLPFNRLHSRILKTSANLVLDSFETTPISQTGEVSVCERWDVRDERWRRKMAISHSLLSRLVSIIPVEW